MTTIDLDKTPAEIIDTGILPCGHMALTEDDNMIIDHCFECGWMTRYRAQSERVNEAAGKRATAEAELIRFVREGFPAYRKIIRLAVAATRAWQNEQFERGQLKKITVKNDSAS